MVSVGKSHASELFQAFGPLRRIPIIAGGYMGMQVEADFFLVQIVTPELISSRFDLAQQISRQIS